MLTERQKHGLELVRRLKKATSRMRPAKREAIKARFWIVRGRQRNAQ